MGNKLVGSVMLLFVIIGILSCQSDDSPLAKDLVYRQEMRNFVQEISIYAKGINPDFAIIPQNGVELVSTTGDKTGPPDMKYINAIDGIGQEDLFYGYDSDDQATPPADNEWLVGLCDMAKTMEQSKYLLQIIVLRHRK